jgi:hypothetical protein
MKAAPKTLQVFLPEGTPAGIQIAELTTRIVQAISVPRTHLKQFFDRPESQYVGTYFLFGGEDDGSKPLAYIGQTEDLRQRLRMHDAKKEFWTKVVILVSRTQSFTQAHIKWLEWNSIAQACEANRYNLENGNAASEPFVTEAIRAEVGEIFETGSLLLQSLGFPIFQPLISKSSTSKGHVGDESEWRLKGPSANAKAVLTADGMVVRAGSLCRKAFVESAKEISLARKRAKLVEQGILVEKGTSLEFSEDYPFKSPSGAASIVLARTANGWVSWKDKGGNTLEQVKRRGE